MPGDRYRPRLSVELTDEQARKLSKYVPWGLQKHLFSAIVDDLLDMMEKGGAEKVIEAIVTGLIKPRDLLKSLNQEEKDGGTS
jgi:hypothetical protein